MRPHGLGRSIEHPKRCRFPPTQFARQFSKVTLGPPVQHRSYDGDSYTSPDISSQVHQSGSRIILIPREKGISCRVDWNEEECHAYCLHQAGDRDCPEIDSRLNRVMENNEVESTTRPNASSHRGVYRDSKNPTSGNSSMIMNPPGISAKPDC